MILYNPNYVKWSTTSQLRQPLVMAGQTHLPAKLNRNELVVFAAERDVINLENGIVIWRLKSVLLFLIL